MRPMWYRLSTCLSYILLDTCRIHLVFVTAAAVGLVSYPLCKLFEQRKLSTNTINLWDCRRESVRGLLYLKVSSDSEFVICCHQHHLQEKCASQQILY